MNKEHRGILIGMILGDGCLNVRRDKRFPNSWHSELMMVHNYKQYDYIKYKAELIHSIFGGKMPKITRFDNNGYDGVRVCKSASYFRILYKWIYKDKKKTITRKILDWLTPHGLAIWWMDDGSLSMKKRNGKIHAREGHINTYITLEQNQIICEWLYDKFDVIAKSVKNKNLYRLRINTTNLKKFIPIIEPYIIPSMQYKIDMQYVDTSAPLYSFCPVEMT